MFTGAEMRRGDLKGVDRDNMGAMLRVFVAYLAERCKAASLPVRAVPFIRPANFVVCLNPNQVLLVVDDVAIGGMPDHTYLDRRTTPMPSLDTLVGAAVRDLAFRNPVGITIPAGALTSDDTARRVIFEPLVESLIVHLRQRALVAGLKLPAGYEHLARFMPEFLRDHPDVSKNVFLLMRFRSEPQYVQIHAAIRDALLSYGLKVLRADDKDYTGDLWENVCLYMLGCAFGVAVFEEIDVREFNPNVALELGFMLALNKRCLLLKDKRMPRMPTDVVGKLYKEFDTYDIGPSIARAIDAWGFDIGAVR